MRRSVHVPVGIFASRHDGFAQVATVPTPFGDAVHVSGQVAWDADRNIVGAGDIGRQLEKSLKILLSLSHRLARNSIRSVRYDSTSGKAIYTKARPSVAFSRRCSATIRHAQRGSGCQASPTMSSWSRWNPLWFFFRESKPLTAAWGQSRRFRDVRAAAAFPSTTAVMLLPSKTTRCAIRCRHVRD
jgi:hypothetical protein